MGHSVLLELMLKGLLYGYVTSADFVIENHNKSAWVQSYT
jgi:hypothetical protein